MDEIRHLHDYIPEFESLMLSRTAVPELPISSLPLLNSKTWGIRPNKLTIIGARTSAGKTSFCLQVANDLAVSNPVLYLSFETKPDELLERLFCLRYRIDNFDLLTGGFGKYQAEFLEFKDHLKNLQFVVADGLGKNWRELNKFIESLTVKPKAIFLDYIQAIPSSSTDGKEFIDEYIRQFRTMSIKYGFAGIIVSQLNRSNVEGDDKTPQLSQLKGSGYLEEHADQVILLHYPHIHDNKKDQGEYIIHLAKNRTGRTGYIKVKYTPECYRFSDLPTEA